MTRNSKAESSAQRGELMPPSSFIGIDLAWFPPRTRRVLPHCVAIATVLNSML
ncbi:MAG: hypothetical protein ABMA00_11075 [Gemmatimonas sp.]